MKNTKPNPRFVVFSAIVIFVCVGAILFREIGLISTRRFEVEVLDFEWNFKEIVDYIDADYPDGAVDIEYDSDRYNRTFFIEIRFKAPPAGAMKFAESICAGVLYQGYDPFDTIDGIRPFPDAKLIFGSGSIYYSYSPNASQDVFGYRCALYFGSSRWEHILVDTSNRNLYEVRYEIPVGGLSPRYSPRLFDDPNGEIEYINPTTDFPFMIIGLVSIDGEYILVGEAICFQTRQNFDYWSQNGLPVDIYPPNLIGTKVDISIDGTLVVDTTISDRWTLSHPNQKDVDTDLLFNSCVFRKNWQQGVHEITLRVHSSEVMEETWTFIVQ